MTETRKAGRPIGAKNKHPQVLRIDIKLPDAKGAKPMQQMTITELGKQIEKSHNALDRLEGCISALQQVTEISGSLPDIVRVVDSLKSTKQNHLDEYKKRIDFKKKFEKVCFDVNIKYSTNPQNIAEMLEYEERVIKERRLKYTSVGISSEKAAEMIPDFDPTARLAEIENCRAIADAWRKFSETGLPEHLPENAPEMLELFGSYEEFTPRSGGVVGRAVSVFD